jgi:hypothetical protein
VVGAYGCAQAARDLGLDAVVGGLTWERLVVDPLPGPRRLDEIDGARVLNHAVALAGPRTTGPGGVRFAESRMAELLGEDVVLVDPHPGPAALAAALDDAARQLACDHVVVLDVGGDVLAHGDEPGLSSPLADAVLLAAAARMSTPATAAVFGAGCDGELTVPEVLAHIAQTAVAGGSRGALGLGQPAIERMRRAVRAVPTEASAMALRCASGATGTATIRDGRKTVELSPVGGIVFLLDPGVTVRATARLAEAVGDAQSLDEANTILTRMGIRTELDYERAAAAAAD